MTKSQFLDFLNVKKVFKKEIENLKFAIPHLTEGISVLQDKPYVVANPLVYNEKFDEVTQDFNIKYIWVTDNPGVKESQQNRYGVGSSGTAGKNFMKGYGLVEDFDREVLILNKSPIHTRVTADLAKFKTINPVYSDCQKLMAKLCFDLHSILDCELWILGTSNLDKIFNPFKTEFNNFYKSGTILNKVFLYNHFSQGQFKKAYNIYKKENPDLSPNELCRLIGTENRKKLFKG